MSNFKITIDIWVYEALQKYRKQLAQMTKKYLALREENKQLKIKLKDLECRVM